MISPLTPQQSRILALLLLIAALMLVAAAIALPAWRLHQHYDHHIEEYADHLARYREIAARKPAIDEALKAVQGRNPQQYYLKANAPTLAAAELQGIVTRVVESHQGRVISSQILQQKDDGKSMPGKMTLSLQMNANIVALQMILHSLETHQPSLFINQMSVRASQGRAYKPAPGAQPEFMVQLTVSAYMAEASTKP